MKASNIPLKISNEIYDKEILAVIKRLKNWKYLLESIKFKVEVWTDHKNLEYFIKVQTSSLSIISIERFNFTLKYVSKTKMEKINRLSRRLN